MKNIMIFDIETDLDTRAVCEGLRLGSHDPDHAREAVGEDFPKLPFHKVIAVGRLEAFFEGGAWQVGQIACDHEGEMDEHEMLAGFDARMEALRPGLVGYNIKGFDLPVMRYRAMILGLAMPGLSAQKYFARYFDNAEDMCDILASYEIRGRLPLDLLSRVLGHPGKPDDVDGSRLGALIAAGNYTAIASYCEQDVILTYLVWLRYQLFIGHLSVTGHNDSLRRLHDHLLRNKPQLGHLAVSPVSADPQRSPIMIGSSVSQPSALGGC